jgi:hypothetical protein
MPFIDAPGSLLRERAAAYRADRPPTLDPPDPSIDLVTALPRTADNHQLEGIRMHQA